MQINEVVSDGHKPIMQPATTQSIVWNFPQLEPLSFHPLTSQ